MLGGIVAMIMMAMPFVTLAIAVTILLGMVVLALSGRKAKSEATVKAPEVESV